MEHEGFLSLLPPLVAIGLAVATRQVFLSLFAGVWMGWVVLAGGAPVSGFVDAVEACLAVFRDPGQTRIIAFCVLVGGLIALVQRSGGVEGFIRRASQTPLTRSRLGVELLAWGMGLVIFVESSITSLVTGTVARPLFDRMKIAREKLAYICDSTSAPVCILIPFNGWGAFVMGLLAAQGVEAPFAVMLQAIPANIYAWAAVALVGVVIFTGKDFGPMARAEARVRGGGPLLREGAEPLVSGDVTSLEAKAGVFPRARNLLIPLGAMVALVPAGLWVTGDGDIMAGSGSQSVFWAVLLAILLAGGLYSAQRIMTLHEVVDTTMKGMGGLIPLLFLMMFAFAIGQTCDELGTGVYLADVAKPYLSPNLLPALLFAVSAVMALATGSSWGTFATMIPIAIPMVVALDANVTVTLAAVLGGGIFGDHCSPLSDTTIIASMASASDHVDHVRTQFPYALVAGGVALMFYLGWGLLA